MPKQSNKQSSDGNSGNGGIMGSGIFGLFGIGYLIDKIVVLLNFKSIDGNIYVLISGIFASLSIYFFCLRKYTTFKTYEKVFT